MGQANERGISTGSTIDKELDGVRVVSSVRAVGCVEPVIGLLFLRCLDPIRIGDK